MSGEGREGLDGRPGAPRFSRPGASGADGAALVVGPAEDDAPEGEAALDARLRAALATGESLRDAAALVAAATGLPRKQVYARALELREGKA